MTGARSKDESPPSLRLRLASASPRRRELLRLTGWDFTVAPSTVDETPGAGETPSQTARRLAREKAEAVSPALPGEWILSADTVVVDDGRLLGKPADASEAERMLLELRGKDHGVVTAIALRNPVTGQVIEDACETAVPMRAYRAEEIENYVASGASFDKAGGYGIQDSEFRPVDLERLEGCYANVMGLPLCHLVRAARRVGFEPPADVPAACTAHLAYDCRVYPAILRGEA
ncbi:MAG: Maf family protein [Anaerolineales bacterium]